MYREMIEATEWTLALQRRYCELIRRYAENTAIFNEIDELYHLGELRRQLGVETQNEKKLHEKTRLWLQNRLRLNGFKKEGVNYVRK